MVTKIATQTNDRTLLIITHILGLFLGFIGPLIILLVADFPNTLAGTMVGKPLRINDPEANLAEEFKKSLLLTVFFDFFILYNLVCKTNMGIF